MTWPIDDGQKRSANGHIKYFVRRRASLSQHASVKRAIVFLYNDVKHMVEGNTLVELSAQIQIQVIDTGLCYCALCFCLLVISITTYLSSV